MEVRYLYDCLDRLEQIHYGNGIRTSYQYDADGNVSHLETRMGSDILLSFPLPVCTAMGTSLQTVCAGHCRHRPETCALDIILSI